MAENRAPDAPIMVMKPRRRAVITAPRFHVPKRLQRLMKKKRFDLRWGTDDVFDVMQACGENRRETWINPVLLASYAAWAEQGGVFALSCWQDGIRVGGIYGVSMGKIFMAESMFSRVSGASAEALVILVAGLHAAGVSLIDVQFMNDHIAQFGVHEISAKMYDDFLKKEIDAPVNLDAENFSYERAALFVQSLSQTS